MESRGISSKAVRRLFMAVIEIAVLLPCIILASLLAPGCAKEAVPVPKSFGGPADVTLILSTGDGTKAQTGSSLNVDETDIVHSIKIFAFKHDPGGSQNNDMVGYASFDGLSGSGTHYLPMSLSASGEIDFYVIANDIYADTETVLGENSTRADIEGLRFRGLRQVDGRAAIPMTNIPLSGGAVNQNNFTFNVEESPDIPQLIPVEVTRALARLSFYFAKSEADAPDIVVEQITLRAQGPASAGYFSGTGSPSYDGQGIHGGNILSEDFNVSAQNVTGSLADDAYDKYGDDTYLLPNIYGTSDPDTAPEGDIGTRGYIVDVYYHAVSGDTSRKHKAVWLPVTAPNDWIKVKGIFNTYVDVDVVVIALYWEESIMDIPFN